MKNYTDSKFESPAHVPRVEIFVGKIENVKEQVNTFLKETPCEVEHIKQSISGTGIVLSLFYYSEELSSLITKETVKEVLGDLFYKYMEGFLEINFDQIMELITSDMVREMREQNRTNTACS